MTGFLDAVEGFAPDAYVPIAWRAEPAPKGHRQTLSS